MTDAILCRNTWRHRKPQEFGFEPNGVNVVGKYPHEDPSFIEQLMSMEYLPESWLCVAAVGTLPGETPGPFVSDERALAAIGPESGELLVLGPPRPGARVSLARGCPPPVRGRRAPDPRAIAPPARGSWTPSVTGRSG